MKKFSDIETYILAVIATIVLVGGVLMVKGYSLGVSIEILGWLAVIAGWKNIPPANPPQIGVLTCWDRFMKVGRKPEREGDPDTRRTIPVTGTVVLMPFFPVFIRVILIDMTEKEWLFKVAIATVEGKNDDANEPRTLVLPVEVRVTVQPDRFHINSYVQSGGKLEKIQGLVEGVMAREVQRLVTELAASEGDDGCDGMSLVEVLQLRSVFNDHLLKFLNGYRPTPGEMMSETHKRRYAIGLFQQNSLGVVAINVSVDAKVPDSVQKAMEGAVCVTYDNQSRMSEYRTDIAAAALIKDQLNVDGERAGNLAVLFRELKDKKVERLQVEGIGKKVGAFVLGGFGGKGMQKQKGGK